MYVLQFSCMYNAAACTSGTPGMEITVAIRNTNQIVLFFFSLLEGSNVVPKETQDNYVFPE